MKCGSTERTFFERNGYVHLPGHFSSQEVDVLQDQHHRLFDRARSILLDLEAGELPGGQAKLRTPTHDGQLTLALNPQRSPKGEAETQALSALRELRVDELTPLDALTWLAKSRAALLAADDEGESA